MLCSALKVYCFQMFMLFYQRKLQLSRNRMRLELTLFFSTEEKYSLKKEKNMRDRRTFWVKKGQTSTRWDKFLNNE